MSDPLIYHTPYLDRIYVIKEKKNTSDRCINVSDIYRRVMFAVNVCKVSSVTVKTHPLIDTEASFFRLGPQCLVLKNSGDFPFKARCNTHTGHQGSH